MTHYENPFFYIFRERKDNDVICYVLNFSSKSKLKSLT
jgi:hypothetical protein